MTSKKHYGRRETWLSCTMEQAWKWLCISADIPDSVCHTVGKNLCKDTVNCSSSGKGAKSYYSSDLQNVQREEETKGDLAGYFCAFPQQKKIS